MDPILIDLLIIGVLVLVNAAFAGTELAVVSLRRSQLVRMADTHGRRGRLLLSLSEEPTRFLSTIQVGITLAGFLASATAAVSLAEPLEPALSFLGDAAGVTALILVTLALTFVTLVFGELVPKRVAMRRPEQWALFAAPPVAFVARFARPVVWLLARTTDVVARFVGGSARTAADDMLTEEEVLDVIATETDFGSERRALVEGVLELQKRVVREVLVPWRDVFFIDEQHTSATAALAIAGNGHSRAPVTALDDPEQVLGIATLGKLVADGVPERPVLELVDEPVIVPENARVQDVLQLLQRSRRQLALVADEHGSYVGIVTVEDLLEEIVGELYDELDRDLDPNDPRGYTQLPDGWFELPGSYPVHDIEDLGLPIPDDASAATVAGLVLDALGEFPVAGQHVRAGELELEVVAIAGTVIECIRIRRA